MAAEYLILGAGGHGRVVLEALRSRGASAAFLDPRSGLRGKRTDGAKVLGGDELLASRKQAKTALANGVGSNGSTAVRQKVYERAAAAGFRFPPVVASSAVVSKLARLEDGAQALTRAVIHPGAVIGVNSVVNTGAIVEHDAVVGAHAFIGPAAVLLGGCRVGAGAFVGSVAVILPGVSVGEGAVVGAGAVVICDVPAGTRVAGVPARRISR